MRHCSVTQASPKGTGTGGFSSPKDPELRKKLKVAIKRTTEKKKIYKPSKFQLAKNSVVCELHSNKRDCIEKNSSGFSQQKRCLKDGVVVNALSVKTPLQEASTQRQVHYGRRKPQQDDSSSLKGRFLEG